MFSRISYRNYLFIKKGSIIGKHFKKNLPTMKHFCLFALSFSLVFTGYTQTTFDRVYTILQTNCTGSCHTTATPSGGLDLSGNKASVYANLFDVTPVNAVASTAGQKRIDPGNPHNSSLFKKINQGLDANLILGSGEGNAEPSGSPAMSQVEREMVRQWILYGARDTGTFVDETNFEISIPVWLCRYVFTGIYQ